MKNVKKVFLFIIAVPVAFVGITLLDFTIHRNFYDDETFSLEIYFDDYLRNYFSFGEQYNDNKGSLLIGQCAHTVSVENENYNNQHLFDLVDIGAWEEEENFWFKKYKPKIVTPKLFEIHTSQYFFEGDTVFFGVNNYTPHAYQISLEKENGNGWATISKDLTPIDSVNSDSLSVNILEKNRGRKLIYRGMHCIYNATTGLFNTGKYRIKAEIENHGSIVSDFEIIERIPVKWTITKKESSKRDSLIIEFKNISNYSLFFLDRNNRNSARVRWDMIIYRNGIDEYNPWGGFGCGTGVYLQCLRPGQSITARESYILDYYGTFDSDDFVKDVEEIYGDSVKITFSILTFSPVWSKYKFQDVCSPEVIIRTKDIIDRAKIERKIKAL